MCNLASKHHAELSTMFVVHVSVLANMLAPMYNVYPLIMLTVYKRELDGIYYQIW